MERLVVNGIPVFWEEGPEPAVATLMFRGGIADEPIHLRGVGHLLEHLVLFAADAPRHHSNGFVDLLRTVFHARGTQSEVEDFLTAVLRELPVPNLDRLDAERRILRTEAAAGIDSFLSRQLFLRHGGASFGAADFVELGLRWVGPEELTDWATARFVAANAVVWVHGPRPPADLPALPAGRRAEPPSLAPRPRMELPVFVADGTGGVAVTAVGARVSALTLALSVAGDRLHEELRVRRAVSYGVGGSWQPLSGSLAHLSIGADCLDEDGEQVVDALLDVLARLAEEGPAAEELDQVRERVARGEDEEPDTPKLFLDRAALDELLGGEVVGLEELRAERQAVTPEAAADALRDAMESAIVLAASGTPKPRTWLHDYVRWNTAVLDGRTFRPTGLRPGRVRMTVGPDGLMHDDGEGTITTIAAGEIVAAVRDPPGGLTVIGLDGATLTVDPPVWRRGAKLLAAVEELVDPELVVPGEASPR